MMEPIISVVMCCYNSEAHIKNAIDSILNQTFKNFEFIIWDDGSTDRTKEIIHSYDDKRIIYLYHENTGLGQALRLACENTSAPIIARMDADDVSLPNRFEKELKYLGDHKEAVLVSSAVNYMDEDNRIIGSSFPYTKYEIIQKIMKSGGSVISHPSSMFRKSDYLLAGGYYPLNKAQDSLLFSKMMKYGKLAIIPEPLLNYRISAKSISSQTQYNDYDRIIGILRQKMINDDIVLENDVHLYNELVACAKEHNRNCTNTVNTNRMRPTFDMKVYDFVVPFLGEATSRMLVIALKNTITTILHKY